MKKLSLIAFAMLCFGYFSYAQDVTVKEIIDNYFENTGGKDTWKSIEGLKMTSKLQQGGMELPLEIVNMKDGRQYTKINVQGNDFFQGVYDGETLWSTNFQSMKPEKAATEDTENHKLNINDFPDPFLDYESKGYTVELMGEESIDGADTYKVKLVKEPITVDGKEIEDVSYYYFEKDAFVPLAVDNEITSGPMAGKVQRITMSDYQEVSGVYFPFSLTQGIKDGPSQPINMESIEVNPEVDESLFKMPESGN